MYVAFAVVSLLPAVLAITRNDYTTSKWFHGEGTYYGPGGWDGGNCAIRGPRPKWMYNYMAVAINNDQYEGMCGACLEVVGLNRGLGANPIKGKFQAIVVDRCPECKHGDLDLAVSGDGRWDIKWRAVPCRKYGPIEYQFEGSHSFYHKMQPRNTRSPPTAVEIAGRRAARSQDNHWVVHNGAGFKYPVKVEVWTILGDHFVSFLNGDKGVVKPGRGSYHDMIPSRRRRRRRQRRRAAPKRRRRRRSRGRKCVRKWQYCRGRRNRSGTSKCCNKNWRCVYRHIPGDFRGFRCEPKGYQPDDDPDLLK